MSDEIELGLIIIAFFVLGHAINAVGEIVYWAWVDWKNKEREK